MASKFLTARCPACTKRGFGSLSMRVQTTQVSLVSHSVLIERHSLDPSACSYLIKTRTGNPGLLAPPVSCQALAAGAAQRLAGKVPWLAQRSRPASASATSFALDLLRVHQRSHLRPRRLFSSRRASQMAARPKTRCSPPPFHGFPYLRLIRWPSSRPHGPRPRNLDTRSHRLHRHQRFIGQLCSTGTLATTCSPQGLLLSKGQSRRWLPLPSFKGQLATLTCSGRHDRRF